MILYETLHKLIGLKFDASLGFLSFRDQHYIGVVLTLQRTVLSLISFQKC